MSDHECLGVEKELCDDRWQPALTVYVMYHALRELLHRSHYL